MNDTQTLSHMLVLGKSKAEMTQFLKEEIFRTYKTDVGRRFVVFDGDGMWRSLGANVFAYDTQTLDLDPWLGVPAELMRGFFERVAFPHSSRTVKDWIDEKMREATGKIKPLASQMRILMEQIDRFEREHDTEKRMLVIEAFGHSWEIQQFVSTAVVLRVFTSRLERNSEDLPPLTIVINQESYLPEFSSVYFDGRAANIQLILVQRCLFESCKFKIPDIVRENAVLITLPNLSRQKVPSL